MNAQLEPNWWQRIYIAIWRYRTNRAFDARDKHVFGSWRWQEANEKVERRFETH